jgi:hypothetical protein
VDNRQNGLGNTRILALVPKAVSQRLTFGVTVSDKSDRHLNFNQ